MQEDGLKEEFREEELLNLSGIQHFVFCRRQWALIAIEDQWSENLLTVEGHLMHERAHDAFLPERRGSVLISRGIPVCSRRLGVSGICDVVEFHIDKDGVPLAGNDGLWRPQVVEYKRGAPKDHDADELQLCCQSMCLEEMLGCSIAEGSLFYGETARRTRVALDTTLRTRVQEVLAEMHALYARRRTPKVKPTKSCNACSLKELCLPRLTRRELASEYIRRHLQEDME